MKLDKQVTQICKGAWGHLRNIRRIRSYLNENATEKLVHAFVSSKLDNFNSLLYGLPQWQLDKLQRIQNTAARIVSGTHKYDHITPVLIDLHWLPINQRIMYKILLLTYKSLNGKAPSYLTDLLHIINFPIGLRSNDNNLLSIPATNFVRYGDRAFSHAAPSLWNKLPHHIRDSTSVDIFKCKLKTFLFQQAFDL